MTTIAINKNSPLVALVVHLTFSPNFFGYAFKLLNSNRREKHNTKHTTLSSIQSCMDIFQFNPIVKLKCCGCKSPIQQCLHFIQEWNCSPNDIFWNQLSFLYTYIYNIVWVQNVLKKWGYVLQWNIHDESKECQSKADILPVHRIPTNTSILR